MQLPVPFRWSIPERFNIGVDVVDRHAAAGTSPALIEVDASGRLTEFSFRTVEGACYWYQTSACGAPVLSSAPPRMRTCGLPAASAK